MNFIAARAAYIISCPGFAGHAGDAERDGFGAGDDPVFAAVLGAHFDVHREELGLMEIRRRLGTEKYGYVRIGPLRLFSLLRTLNLETREKRHRFYRSR